MDSLPFNLEDIKLEPNTFADVGICVSGTVDQKLIKLFESGGAKVRTYSGVLVSHFIAGSDADENKVEEAKDIFELPIVSPRWIAYSALLGKTLPTDGFKGETNQLFSKITATTSGIVGEDLKIIWASLTYYGGSFSKHLTNRCTHLIINKTSGNKYHQAKEKGLKIVTCDWVTDCIKRDQIVDEVIYDPTLLTGTVTAKTTATTTTGTKPAAAGGPVQTGKSSNSDNQDALPEQFTVNVNVATPQIRPQIKQPPPVSVKNVAGNPVMVRPVVPVHSQNILQTQLLLQNPQSKAGINQAGGTELQQKHFQQPHLQNFQQQQLQHQQQLQNSQSQQQLGQQHIQLMQSPQSQQQKGLQTSSPAQQQLPQTSQAQQQLLQPHVQQHQIVQTSQGQQIVQTSQGQQIIQTSQGPQMIQTSQGPQIIQTSQGQQIIQTSQGPQMIQISQGSQIIQTSQGPQIIQTSQGPQIIQTSQGPQIIQTSQGPQIIQTSQGPQIIQTSQGQQIIQTSQGQQIIQTSQGQQIIQTSQGQQIIQTSQGQQQLIHTSPARQIQSPQITHSPQIQQQLVQNSQIQQQSQTQHQQKLMQSPQSQQLIHASQPQQQILQSSLPQQHQLIQGSQTQQLLQSNQPQQLLQNQGQQGMQGPGQQLMQGTPGQQLLQGSQGQQLMQSPQGQQQLMQGSQGHQIIQGSQGQQQIITGSQGQQIMSGPQGQQQIQQQLISGPPGQQQLISGPQGQQQLITGPQGQQQLITGPQGQQQLITGPQGQQQLITVPQGQQQLISGPQGQQQIVQGQQQLMQSNQNQQQMMQNNQNQQQMMQNNQNQQQMMQSNQNQQQLMQGPQGQQLIQVTQGQQQIAQNTQGGPQQQNLMQGSQPQQKLLQGVQQPQQLMQNSQTQQQQLLQVGQGQQQIMQTSQGQQQLIPTSQPQQQLIQSSQLQQQQLMQNLQPQQQLVQGSQPQTQQMMQGSQPQFMQGSQGQQQLIQNSQPQSHQIIQTTQQQNMHPSSVSQQLILQSQPQQQQQMLTSSPQQHQILQSPQQQQMLQNSQIQQIHTSQQSSGQHLSQHQMPLQSHQHAQFHMTQQPNRGPVMVSQVSQINNFQPKTIQGQQMSQQMQQLLQQSSAGQNINVSIHQQNALRQQNPQQIHVMSSAKSGQLIQALQHQQNQNQLNMSQQSGNQINMTQQVSQGQINISQQQQVHIQQQTLNIQHLNSSLSNQIPVQLQQGQQKQMPPQSPGQISVQQQGFSGQQGSQQYNVVMQQGQQYQKFVPSGNVPNQQVGQLTTTVQTGPNGQPIGVQKVQFQTTGPRLTTVQHQWSPTQQLEIIRQIQMDPQIKQQWAQMDQQQRTLLIQKLAQRNREEHLRREMMLRQQQLNQHGANMQQSQQQKTTIISQVGVPQQVTNTVPQHTVITGQQQIINNQNQTIVVQSPQQPTVQTQQIISGPGQHVVSQSHQVINQNQTLPSQQQINSSPQQITSSQLQQQQLIVQTNQNVQQISSPIVNSGQSVLVQNHQIIGQQNQQKALGQPMQQQTLKFIPPGQVQQIGTRPQTQMIVTQQQQQGTGVVRTQQIFTPQVAQHPQQQQQRINVRHILVHQGQQPPRLPQQQIILQQGPPGSSQPQPKIAILQTHQQSPSTPNSQQWVATPTGQPQRMGSPNQTTQAQVQHRLPTPEQHQTPPSPTQSPQQHPSSQWNVQVVHSKTKTALANLLSNRLQGANGPEPVATISTPTTVTGSQTMCPPPPPAPAQSQSVVTPQVTSPTAPHNIVIQRRTLSNLQNGNKTVQVSNVAVGRAPVTQQPTSPLTGSPVRTQHQYYGYDPSIKLPPEGFLLGCVFWSAEVLDYTGWELTVMKYGGEVEIEYGPRITHVLCDTQRFPEFQQCIREGKRLVTLTWLSDICVRKCMTPPFYALHLPVAFSKNDQPLKGQLFCLTGFSNSEDRRRAKIMCLKTGADVAPFFARNIHVLLANKVDTLLYQKAREYRKPVVNIQFLNEVLFGHSSCMQMIHSPKYQHFNLDQTFRFDVTMVPHLMAAWKTPMRVNNDIFEKFKNRKRNAEPSEDTSPKKAKIDDFPPTPPLILKNVVFDDDSPSADAPPKHHVSVTCSGYTLPAKAEIKRIMEKLPGARYTDDPKHANVLIIRLGMRTPKLFSCLSHVDVIVDYHWIMACCDAGRILDPKEYSVEDPTFERDYGVKFSDIFAKPGRHTLFSGIKFYVTPGLKLSGLEELIECAGGTVDSKQRSLKLVRELALKSPRRYVVLSCIEDYRMLSSFFESSKPCPRVQTPDFVLKSIAKQKVLRRLVPLIIQTDEGA